ncbi:MAG: PA14 domain-containing protein [Actinomycetota bacterium]
MKGDFSSHAPKTHGFVKGKSEELASKRTRDSKTYRNPDGSFLGVFGHGIHYKDAAGKWVDVDHDFHASGADSVANLSDVVVRATKSGVRLSQRINGIGIAWLTPTGPSVKGDTATYRGDEGLDWSYKLTPNGVKLTAEVASRVGPRSYSFPYELLGGARPLAQDTDGTLAGDGFVVPRPIVEGADHESYPAGDWTLKDGALSFDFDDSALPEDAFPYRLDPSTTFNDYDQASGDQGSVEKWGSTYPPSASTTVWSFDPWVQRSYYSSQFHVSVGLQRWNTSSIPDTAVIQLARIDLWSVATSNDNGRYLTADWYSAWPIDAADWTATAQTSASGSPGWDLGALYDGPFTLVNGAANVSKTGYTGLRFHISGGQPTGTNETQISPALTVLYNNAPPPTPTLSSPADNSVVNTLAPPLTVNQDLDPNSENVYFDYTISSNPDGTGDVVDSGWIQQSFSGSTTWTPSEGALSDGRTYYWRVRARDKWEDPNTSYSAWSGVRSLRVDLSLGERSGRPYDRLGPLSVNLASGNLSLSVSSPSVNTVGGPIGLSYTYNSVRPQVHGLTGAYYNDTNANKIFDASETPAVVRTDPQILFYWFSNSPYSSVNADHFLVRWQGYVTVPTSGTYKFGTMANDGTKVWINNALVLDNWLVQNFPSDQQYGSGVSLTAGQTIPIKVEYFDDTGSALMQLWTNGPCGTAGAVQDCVVPSSWLMPEVVGLPGSWLLSADPNLSLAYTKAAISDRQVVLSDATGAPHVYTWSGSGWTPPPDEGGILINDSASGLLNLHADDGYIYSFNADGTLASVQSALDDKTPAAPAYTWTLFPSTLPLARLSRITDPVSGRYLSLVYGVDGGCPSGSGFTAPPSSALCKIDYGAFGLGETGFYYSNGNLARIVDPGGATIDFGYDSSGLLTQMRDGLTNDLIAAGIITDGTSDTHKTLISYTGRRTTQITFPLSAAGGSRPQRTYDYPSASNTKMHVAGMSEPLGYTKQVTLDSQGRVIEEYDVAGKKTTYVYDAADQVMRVTDPTGIVNTTIYDEDGHPTDSYGPGAATEFGADNRSTTAPHSSTAHDEGISGLAGAWWDIATLAGSPKAHTTMTAWPNWGSGSPASGIPTDGFSGLLTGVLTAPSGGNYSFAADADSGDGVRVLLDDSGVIERWETYKASVLADVPKGYWRLGEASGTSAIDTSGAGNSGTYIGGPTLGVAGMIGGDTDTASTFVGASKYVAVTPGSPTSLSAPYTVETWVKPSTATGTLGIFGTRFGGDNSFDLKLMNGNKIHSDIGNGSSWITTAADANFSYAAGDRIHIVYVVTPDDYTIYANGAQVGSGDISGTPLLYNATHTIRIGNSTATEGFNGTIDEVAVYPVALAPERVEEHYLASSLTGSATLAAGTHRFQINYKDSSGPARLTINWTPPGGTAQPIPMASLAPGYDLLTTSTDPDGRKNRTEYDAPEYGLATASVLDPDGFALRSTMSFEPPGTGYFRPTSRTLPKGAATTVNYAYYGAGDTTTNPCTGLVGIVQAGQLRTSTSADPDGAGPKQPIMREFRYDAAGRIVANRVVGDTNWKCVTYDTRGRITSQTDSAGKTSSTNYTTPGVVAISYVDSSGGNRTTIAASDWIGQPLRYTDENGTTTRRVYDLVGRVSDTFRQFEGQSETQLTHYGYDPTTSRLGSLTEYASGTGRTTTFTYDDAGRLKTTTRPNNVTTTNTFNDSRGWLDSISNKKGSTELSPWTYQRNPSSNVASEVTTGRTRTFSYDGAGRLYRTVEGATTRNYYFDANSNRCSTVAACTGTSSDQYQYDNADRLTASPFASSYTYDAHGNITAANLPATSTQGSLNQPASFDAGASLAPESFPFVVGQTGNASAQYVWSPTASVNHGGTYTGTLAIGGTSTSPMLFDGQAYGIASLSWARGTHLVHPTSSDSVTAGGSNSYTVAPNTSGTMSASLDWSPTSNSQTWSGSVANLGIHDQQITASASGSLTASLSWPSKTPNPDLDLYLMDGPTVLTMSTKITGNSESISFTVPSSVTYSAKKTYTLEVRAKTTGSSFTLNSTWPVTADLDLELWRGSTKVASSYSTTAKPENVSAAGQPAGTYSWKVVSKDYPAAYDLVTTQNQLDYADLTFSLKDPGGVTVSAVRGSSGSLQLPGDVSPAGGQYTLNVVDNSFDLDVPSFSLPWSTTTLGDDSAAGTIPASGITTKTTAADASGFAQGSLNWTQGTHTVSTSGSRSIAPAGSSSINLTTNTTGTMSSTVDWNSSTTSGSWNGNVANLGTYNQPVTASAGGTLSATVTWPSKVPNPDLDILIVDGGTTVASNTTIADPNNTATVTYTVPSGVTLSNPHSYTLRVKAKATGGNFTLTSTWPVTANLNLELWRGTTLVTSSNSASAKPETISASSQPAGSYTLKIISADYSATASYSITYSQLDYANLTLRIKNAGGSTLASQSSASGTFTLQTTLASAGTYTFETTNNSSDLNVPSYSLAIKVPRQHAATAKLELKNTAGTSLSSSSGGGTLNVSASGLPAGKYFAVLTALTGSGSGTISGSYPGRVPLETIAYDGNDHATVIRDGTATTTETLAPSGRVLRRRSVDDVTGDVLEDTVYGYEDGGDSPSYAMAAGGGSPRTYVKGPEGLLLIDDSGQPSYPLYNGHGDIVGTADATGNFTAAPVTDEFGVGNASTSRLGWAGRDERFATGGGLRLMRMGVRLYDPVLGRFLGVDPVEGGSLNAYDYAAGDPVNNADLDGTHCSGQKYNSYRYVGRRWKRLHDHWYCGVGRFFRRIYNAALRWVRSCFTDFWKCYEEIEFWVGSLAVSIGMIAAGVGIIVLACGAGGGPWCGFAIYAGAQIIAGGFLAGYYLQREMRD